MRTVLFLAVALLAAVCVSACAGGETGDAPLSDAAGDAVSSVSPYIRFSEIADIAYGSEPYSSENCSGESDLGEDNDEADEATPPYPHVLDTTRMYIGYRSMSFSPHRIDEGEIIIVTSDGVTSEERSLLFTLDKYSLLPYIPQIDWMRHHAENFIDDPLEYLTAGWWYRVYAFSNDNILFWYVSGFSLGGFSSAFAIKNLTSGEVTALGSSMSRPVILDNDMVAMFDALSRVGLYDIQTGLLADVQLDFDYGRLMYEAVGCRHFPNAYEMYVFGLVFDTQTRQYLMLYAQDTGVRHDEQGYWIYDQGRLAVFDEAGRQIDSFEIENLGSWRGEAQMTISPHASDMLIYEGRVYINSYELDIAARFYHVRDRDRGLSWSERRRIMQGPPLPLTIIYTAEGTHIYSEGGDLLQTLDSGFALSFYTFNESGDAVMLFYRRAS